MKKKGKFNFDKEAPNIIFGIASGAGLFFLSWAISSLIVYFIPILDRYFLITYVLIHLFTLIGTAKMYTTGLFKVVYIISSLILLLVSLYTKIFGVI